MADNVQLNIPTTSGARIASDDIGGVQHQRVKVQFGADGTATDVSAADPLPVATGLIQPTTPTDTQPVSGTVAVSSLPAGLATSANQQTDGLTDAELRATPVPVSGTVSTGGLTDAQLRATPVPISGAGDATAAKQTEQTALITTLNSLIENLNSLVNVLLPLGAAMNSGQPALRVNPIAAAATVVSGSVTATVASTVVSSLTNFGTGIPATEMAHDMNNLTAIMANINNVTA